MFVCYAVLMTNNTSANLTPDTIYVEQWSTFDAEEAGRNFDGTLVSPAPFGDNTYRVIDEKAGGVVAYFGSEEAALEYANFLVERGCMHPGSTEIESTPEDTVWECDTCHIRWIESN